MKPIVIHWLLVLMLLSPLASNAYPSSDGHEEMPLQDQEGANKVMCEKVSCAFDVRIVVAKKDGSVFDKTFPVLPVVQPNGVSIYAGQNGSV
jgi:hypothetical protein